jgi:hypothetical protein
VRVHALRDGLFERDFITGRRGGHDMREDASLSI